MAIEAEDFCAVALSSHNLGNEIGFRNCISRSYYAMYHEVLGLLHGDIPSYAGGGVHSCLIKYLQEGSANEPFERKELRRISYILRQHRDLRFDADYELHLDSLNDLTSAQALEASHKVRVLCQELRAKAA